MITEENLLEDEDGDQRGAINTSAHNSPVKQEAKKSHIQDLAKGSPGLEARRELD